MAVNGYAYMYTDTASGQQRQFVLGGISEDVAKGVRAGLRKVTTIHNVVVEQIVETREEVTGPDPV